MPLLLSQLPAHIFLSLPTGFGVISFTPLAETFSFLGFGSSALLKISFFSSAYSFNASCQWLLLFFSFLPLERESHSRLVVSSASQLCPNLLIRATH